MLRLSIIIPVYNLESYISETLDSCLNQNIPHSDYEIICINDGSKDRSAEIICEYAKKHPNIRLFNQDNSGVSVARNKGLSLAGGRYIWFVDGDDLIASNCLSDLLNIVERDNIDILGIGMQSVSDRLPIESSIGAVSVSDPDCDCVEFLSSKGGNGGGVCSQIYRAEILRDIRFTTEIKYSEDVLFSYKAAMSAKICAKTESVLYFYYQRAGSAMHSQNHVKFIDSMHLLAQEYLSLADEEPEYRELSISKKNFAVKALLFSLAQSGDVKASRGWLQQLKAEGLYPFPLLWCSLKGNTTLKQALINYVSFLFPWKPYFMLCVRLMSLKNKLRRKNI